MNAPIHAPMNALGPAGIPGLPLAADAATLSALVREAVASGLPRRVLHIRLAPHLLRAHHHRLLREALEPVLRPTRAKLFALPGGDLIALAPGETHHFDSVAAHLRTLLAGMDSAWDAPPPITLLRLPEQAVALLATLEASLHPDEEDPVPPGAAALPDAVVDQPTLARLERSLATAGLGAFLRCRPVLRMAPGARGGAGRVREWQEWRIATAALAAALLGPGERGRDLGAGRPPGGGTHAHGLHAAGLPTGGARRRLPLARPLRTLLDRRLLAELARPEEAQARGPMGLSLGLSAIAAAEFHRFDQSLGPEGRARVVIGIDAEEILADPNGFLAARAVLSGRGYRLAVNLADPEALALLPRAALGVELARLRALPGVLGAAGRPLPEGWPPDAIVMTGVDRASAVGWGWEAGITLFEGRLFRN